MATIGLRIKQIGEGGAHYDILADGCGLKMLINGGGTFEKFLESRIAQCKRDGKADRGPQRIATPYAFGKRQHARFINAPFHRLIRRGGERNDPAIGIVDAAFAQPFERAERVGDCFGGGERLGGQRDHRGGRIALVESGFERAAIDIGDHVDRDFCVVQRQGFDGQRGAERRAADADMDEAAHFAQQSFVDRIDQPGHARTQRLCLNHHGGRAIASLGAVRSGAALGIVYQRTGKQLLALGGEIHGEGDALKNLFGSRRQMRF